MTNLVLFGLPGAGKSTQSKFLIKKYDFCHICPGHILREAIQQKTPLGQKVQTYIDKGLLAPDELVIDIVGEKMKKIGKRPKGFLFDGYPRTYLQALALDKQLTSLYKSELSIVIVLNIDEGEGEKRIEKRSKILHRADDQNKATITTRMQSYQATTLPVLDYYQKQKKIVKIQGQGSIDQVSSSLQKAISKHISF